MTLLRKPLATEKGAVEAAIETRSAKVVKAQDDKSDQAEEAPEHQIHDEKSDEKTQFKRSEARANTAEQAYLPANDSTKENNDIENISKPAQNMSEATSGHQQFKNWLVCNYCDQSFANEGLIRNHTEIEHRSGRIRYRRI